MTDRQTVCMRASVLLHACACVVIKSYRTLTRWFWWADSLFLPADSSSQSCYHCCTYCSPLALHVRIRHCTHRDAQLPSHATTRTGSHVRTCTSCRVAGEWRSVHVRTTEPKRCMSTVLDKCTLLTYNNMTTL